MRNTSGHSLQFTVTFISFIEQGAWKKVALFFNGVKRHFIVCMLHVVLVFQCHALKRYRPIDKKCTFLHFSISGEYRQ